MTQSNFKRTDSLPYTPASDKAASGIAPLLVACLGNSNLRLALFEGPAKVWDRRVPTGQVDRACLPALPNDCSVALISVVPDLATTLALAWSTHPILNIGAATVRLASAYRPPAAMGADRVANALALFRGFGAGIAVDCGTATTLTVVDPAGCIQGGAILPGLGTARESLHNETAQLPAVPLIPFPGAWGRNSVEAMQLGLIEGHIGALNHLIARFRPALGDACAVVLTGGWSTLLSPLLADSHIHEPDLTLQGAALAWAEADPTWLV